VLLLLHHGRCQGNAAIEHATRLGTRGIDRCVGLIHWSRHFVLLWEQFCRLDCDCTGTHDVAILDYQSLFSSGSLRLSFLIFNLALITSTNFECATVNKTKCSSRSTSNPSTSTINTLASSSTSQPPRSSAKPLTGQSAASRVSKSHNKAPTSVNSPLASRSRSQPPTRVRNHQKVEMRLQVAVETLAMPLHRPFLLRHLHLHSNHQNVVCATVNKSKCSFRPKLSLLTTSLEISTKISTKVVTSNSSVQPSTGRNAAPIGSRSPSDATS